ncbi:MAG: histidinol-phosphate transaminase [Gemmatimonadota bacterium]|jgi:histidinol-phosphate aminotransferase
MGAVVRAATPPTPPRADLERIWPYVPGRHRTEILREYGVRDVLKLASNENPVGPSPRAVAALAGLGAQAHQYPDSQAVALRAALGDRHGVSAEQIVIGNGSVECIDLVARAFLRPEDQAIVGFPSFPRFQIACQVVGCGAVVVPHRDWRFDLDGMTAAISHSTRVVFVDNPCNPVGTHIGPAELATFLDRIPPEVLVVLDEAYHEFVPAERLLSDEIDRIKNGHNLVVLRTFSKAHGLAGLRIGYAIARPETARAMNRVREAFNAGVYAQAGALAAIDDDEHVRDVVELVSTERNWLAGELARLGFSTIPSETNFLFTQLGSRAEALNQGLLECGIIIRPMVAPGIETWARISIPDRSGGQRLITALEELVA